jgi:glycosyltransferase involved in cell wall biosynthesis
MFDVIIATYNRFEKAKRLALDLLKISNQLINQIIIVDSSDTQTVQSFHKQIHHVITLHKNQPLQRYIGYKKATADYLLFLDDDMEIADNDCLEKLSNTFSEQYVGIAIHFNDKHQDTSLNQIAKSAFNKNNSSIGRFINWLSAYPNLSDGIFGLCGVRGKQPSLGGRTEFVSGGAFAAKRSDLYKNFNFELFDLYKKKLGKGEDAIIGFTLSKQGGIYYHPDLMFYHNDQKDSSYSIDQFSFSRRVTFSRKYLSLEKTRLEQKSMLIANLYFHWHTFWRIMGLGINFTFKSTANRKQMLLGALAGWQASFSNRFIYKEQFVL